MTLSLRNSFRVRGYDSSLYSMQAALCTSAVIAVALVLVSGSASAQGTGETDDEKAFYAIGAGMANQFESLKPISDRELELIYQGLRDGLDGTVADGDSQENRTRIRKLLQARKDAALKVETAASATFLATEANRAGAVKTESGLIITEIEPGTGPSPTATSKVKVHYHGTLRDGTVFDSSVDRGQPAEFPLKAVIPCWTEGVAKMKTGGKSKLVCPPDIAYGDERKGRIPPGSVLIFEVELIEVVN